MGFCGFLKTVHLVAVRKRPITVLPICILIGLVLTVLMGYGARDAITDFASSLYSAKTNSASAHFSSLVPEDSMLDISFPLTFLFGDGGFSENFYWRLLINFGWIGFSVVGSVLLLWLYYSLRGAARWRHSIAPWAIAVLIGSNGIAYLLTFPLNLIFWSTLALVVQEKESDKRPGLALPAEASHSVMRSWLGK